MLQIATKFEFAKCDLLSTVSHRSRLMRHDRVYTPNTKANERLRVVTYLDIGKTMLVWAVWLLADAILQEGSAHRHALWIELM